MKILVLAALLLTTASAQTQRWEYGLLTVNIGSNPLSSIFFWETGSNADSGSSSAALLKRIAGKAYAGLKNPTTSVAVFNYLGSQGWELVSATSTPADGNERNTWFFKRSLR